MQLVDSHAHIYLEEFKADRHDTLMRAIDTGVEKIYMPNVDHSSIEDMLNVAEKYQDLCIPMIGLHPCYVKKDFQRDLYEVEDYLNRGGFCAVGEIGTDLYWDTSLFEQQKEVFAIQCDLALKFKLPVVIHCRNSIDETIELIKPFAEKGLKGVFHCFTGTIEQALIIEKMGFKLGLGGVATFKKGGLEPVIKGVDLKNILIETDCPYLAPSPHRGKRNEPSYVRFVAEKIALELGREITEIGEITSANSKELFGR